MQKSRTIFKLCDEARAREDSSMSEYVIELNGQHRADGSFFITSSDLPMFSIVGASVDEAINLVKSLLPEYLRANVPSFVELREISSATEIISKRSAPAFPVHYIARTGDAHVRNTLPAE